METQENNIKPNFIVLHYYKDNQNTKPVQLLLDANLITSAFYQYNECCNYTRITRNDDKINCVIETPEEIYKIIKETKQ